MGPQTIVFFAVGTVALVAGAEGLVRGASRLAARTGLSPIVIGLTVVAFGTSAPELAVSLGAVFRDETDIALGNVVGSNIANVLLVLGLSGMLGGGLVVAQRIVRIDVPLMIAASALLLVLALDEQLGRVDGLVLVVLLVGYVSWTVVAALRDPSKAIAEEYDEALHEEKLRASSPLTDTGFVLAGLVLLVVGSQALVSAATDIAVELGVSDLVIGLTVVAVGTSLPELATSVLAATRGQRDLAVGNAIGSNLFNILAVLGISATVASSPLPVDDGALTLDLPVMIAVAVACLPLFASGYVLARWEGTFFVVYYAAYVLWLVLDATEHEFRNAFAVGMVAFVLPLTTLTLAVIGYRVARAGPIGGRL
jgi:cation:H+ antiporter